MKVHGQVVGGPQVQSGEWEAVKHLNTLAKENSPSFIVGRGRGESEGGYISFSVAGPGRTLDHTIAEFIVPVWGDKVNCGIGLLYRTACVHRLKGSYDNPLPKLTISFSQGLWIWPLTRHAACVAKGKVNSFDQYYSLMYQYDQPRQEIFSCTGLTSQGRKPAKSQQRT
jgi:hypothetical protein